VLKITEYEDVTILHRLHGPVLN